MSSRVVITPASRITPRPVSWLWEGRIPLGELTLLAGMGGLGKSILACDRAARLSRGQLDGDRRGDPVSVIYMTAEDSWESTLVPRLMAAGANLDRIMNVEIPGDDGYEEGLSIPEDITDLMDAMSALRSPSAPCAVTR